MFYIAISIMVGKWVLPIIHTIPIDTMLNFNGGILQWTRIKNITCKPIFKLHGIEENLVLNPKSDTVNYCSISVTHPMHVLGILVSELTGKG